MVRSKKNTKTGDNILSPGAVEAFKEGITCIRECKELCREILALMKALRKQGKL